MEIGSHVRRTDDFNPTRIDNDEMSTFSQSFFQARPKDRMSLCGVGSHHDNHVSIGNGRKILCSRRLTQGLLQTVTRWGVAHTSAGIDVVVTKSGPNHFLDQPHFLIRAA